MKAITKHYIIDGAFVESHGRRVMESISPSNGMRKLHEVVATRIDDLCVTPYENDEDALRITNDLHRFVSSTDLHRTPRGLPDHRMARDDQQHARRSTDSMG